MILQEVLNRTTGHFKKLGLDSPRLDAELLLANALGMDRIQLYLQFDCPLDETQLVKCREVVKRRTQGEPVAYILGYRDFYTSKFKVTKDVLVPRPETELVVESALGRFKNNVGEKQRIVDLGCGSGCIGLSLLKELPLSQLFAADISEAAVLVAEENAKDLGLSDRATIVCADASEVDVSHLPEGFEGLADVVVANPPYIDRDDPNVAGDVKKFEPYLALFAEDNGLGAIKSWSRSAAQLLRPGGWFITEVGFDQAADVVENLNSTGQYLSVQIKQDYAGKDRVVIAERGLAAERKE